MTNSEISSEVLEILHQETETLDAVLKKIKQQKERCERRLGIESTRARELTSQLVAASTDEDKQLLASDEAVSHVLARDRSNELQTLESQQKKPYFARLVVEEEQPGSSKLQQLEYKIGLSSNPDCRIIDWRRAPVSKLYYEYREGDAYSEEIQGREREGEVILRNTVEIDNSHLKKVACRHGEFVRTGKDWQPTSGRRAGSTTLPAIVSLITPEQFRMITEDARTAVLIQGNAGSGKTTVALHRLAWLLHEDNSELTASDCLVLVATNPLKNYISGTLPSLDVPGVKISTYSEWVQRELVTLLPTFAYGTERIKRPDTLTPIVVRRLKRSQVMLEAIHTFARTTAASGDLTSQLKELLKQKQLFKDKLEKEFLAEDSLENALHRFEDNLETKTLDPEDDTLLLLLHLARGGAVPSRKNNAGEKQFFSHLVLDETQDFAPTELSTVVHSVPNTRDLTLVGDTAQQIHKDHSFAGWDALIKTHGFAEQESQFLSLEVSHRSTRQIMNLAQYVQQKPAIQEGRDGRRPIHFYCPEEEKGIEAALKWLDKAVQLYPQAVTAVICRTSREVGYVASMLRPQFGHLVRQGRHDSFSFEEGIVVTDVEVVKGLEFTNVLLWNVSSRYYDSSQHSRNLLYVGMTRAEENLAMISWNNSSELLPAPSSPLLRFIDLTPDEEEEENEYSA